MTYIIHIYNNPKYGIQSGGDQLKPLTTIRSHLEAYLYSQQLSINQFSIQSGVNSGTLSRILSGQQPIAMNHLKLITRGMSLPEDHSIACMSMSASYIRHQPGGGCAPSS